MPKCSICCENRKRIYQLCSTCTKDDSKRSCLKCHSEMLFTCPPTSNCVALHKKCAYCQTPMSQKQLNASILNTSVHYLKKANELYFKQLNEIVVDRADLYGIIKSQKRLIEFFRDHMQHRLGTTPQPVPVFHFNYILAHVNHLLKECGFVEL